MRTIVVFGGPTAGVCLGPPPKHPHRSPAVAASVCPERLLRHLTAMTGARSGEPFLWLIHRVSFGRIPNILCDTVRREQAIAPDAWQSPVRQAAWRRRRRMNSSASILSRRGVTLPPAGYPVHAGFGFASILSAFPISAHRNQFILALLLPFLCLLCGEALQQR